MEEDRYSVLYVLIYIKVHTVFITWTAKAIPSSNVAK